MLRQEFVVNARVVVEALQLGRAGNFEQVLVAGLVFGQEQEMIGFFVLFGVAVAHGTRRHVCFHPDDGFDFRFDGCVVELDDPEHGSVVGEGHGGHSHLFGALHQFVNFAEAVQQGVFGMVVEVDEGHEEGRREKAE